MAAAEALLSPAEQAWEAADYGRARSLAERAKAAAQQTIQDAESALQQINEAREAIAAGVAERVDMAAAEDLLSQAEEAWEAADYGRARSLAERAKAAAQQTIQDAESALQQINEAREAIVAGVAERVDMGAAEALLSRAEEAFQGGDYERARELALQAKELTPRIVQAGEAIHAARASVEQERARRINLTSAEALLSRAEEAFQGGDYERARELALQVKELTPRIVQAGEAIHAARASVEQERAKGFHSARAEELLAQAEKAFEDGEYQSAGPLALRARSIALDIDGDGVRNEEDFAPTVHNTYIYIGGAAILASLALVTPLAVRRRRKRRADLERARQLEAELKQREAEERASYQAKIREFEAQLKQWKDEGYVGLEEEMVQLKGQSSKG
ncbi:MAG: hypothetical protein DDT25_00500 [Chloroflexi bacterium]|nr:hypothetical protein [Chloroflexota bacterium]